MSLSSAKLTVFVSSQLACVKIQGRANFASSIDFKLLVNELLAQQYTCFVLDLTDCTLMDSTFLGVLAGFGLKMKKDQKTDGSGPSLELMNANPRIMELLENLGVLELFRIFQVPSVELAPDAVSMKTVESIKPTREDITRNCLEAHKTLMALTPENAAKFKDVTKFLAEDLKKMQGVK